MAWDDTPPSQDELAKAPKAAAWDAEPPSEDEIKNAGMKVVDWKGKGEAGLQGFGQAATMGYLPQLQAAVGGLIPDPNKGLDEELAKKGFKVEQSKDNYLARRDSALMRDQALKEENPGSYLAGQVGGVIATAPMVGSKLAKLPGLGKTAASLGGRLLQGAAGGAVQGAVQNPGDTQGEIDPLQIEERKANAGKGAALGAAAQLGGEIIGKGADLIKNTPKAMEDWAALKAFKSAGGVKKHWEAAERGVGADEIGKEMIKQGVVKPGATYEDIAKSAGALKQKAGNVISSAYKEATDIVSDPKFQASLSPQQQALLVKTDLNAVQIADDLEHSLAQQFKGRAGGTKALGEVRATLDELRQNGSASMETLQSFKGDLDHMINYNKALSDQPAAKQALKSVRDEIKNRMQARLDALDNILGSDRLGSLKEANRQYGIWANAEGAAKDRVLRENANRFLSPSDYFSGGMGAVAGFASGDSLEGKLKNAAIGSTLGLANKGMRLYGNPVAAKAALGVGGALGKIPQQLPNAMAAIGNVAVKNPAVFGAGAKNVLGGPKAQPGAPVEESPAPPVMGDEPKAPLKGTDKWASQGIEKLGIRDHALAQQLLKDPEGKRLLIEASRHAPGSAEMKRITDQIKRGWVDRQPARQGKGTP